MCTHLHTYVRRADGFREGFVRVATQENSRQRATRGADRTTVSQSVVLRAQGVGEGQRAIAVYVGIVDARQRQQSSGRTRRA